MGPVLVRDGVPVYRSNEGFTTSQLAPRGPRTAVGQRADGGVVLVTTDGRQPGLSVGHDELRARADARPLRRRSRHGARRGRLLDARVRRNGAELAVRRARARRLDRAHAPVLRRLRAAAARGRRLAERRRRRRDAEALVQDRPSVDRDGHADRSDGTVAFQESGAREPGTYDVAFPPLPPPPAPTRAAHRPSRSPPAEGRWTFTVSATDDQGSAVDDDAAVRCQLDARLAPRRADTRGRWTNGRTGRHSVVAGTGRPREGDDRDAGRHRRSHGHERDPPGRRRRR